jgi:hypothetical protein
MASRTRPGDPRPMSSALDPGDLRGRHPTTSLGRVLTGSVGTAVIERARATVAVVPQRTRSV